MIKFVTNIFARAFWIAVMLLLIITYPFAIAIDIVLYVFTGYNIVEKVDDMLGHTFEQLEELSV